MTEFTIETNYSVSIYYTVEANSPEEALKKHISSLKNPTIQMEDESVGVEIVNADVYVLDDLGIEVMMHQSLY